MAGKLERFQIRDSDSPGLESLLPGQCLISDRKIGDTRLEVVSEIGRFTVYRFSATRSYAND